MSSRLSHCSQSQALLAMQRGGPEHTLIKENPSWTCYRVRQCVPAPPNWLPSLGEWALWYFLVVDMWVPVAHLSPKT